MEYGYARVSTKEQNEQRQIVALKRVVKAVPLHHRLLDIERMQENCC